MQLWFVFETLELYNTEKKNIVPYKKNDAYNEVVSVINVSFHNSFNAY